MRRPPKKACRCSGNSATPSSLSPSAATSSITPPAVASSASSALRISSTRERSIAAGASVRSIAQYFIWVRTLASDKGGLLDLAVARPRERVDQFDRPRDHEGLEPLPARRPQRRRSHGGLAVGHDEGLDRVPEDVVGYPDHRCVQDAGQRSQ